MRTRLVLVAALVVITGCDVEPYCLTCRDGEVELDGGPDAGRRRDGGMVGPDDAGPPRDAGPPDGCVEGELCNDNDDDCDGFVDEGYDLETNPEHCGECGNFCIFAHAFAMCVDGGCEMGDCDVGFYDENDDPSDGCEYNCPGTSTDDAVCNLRDDDCDGTVDEDVLKQTDPMNCGVCGRVCNFAHASATCAAGVCTRGDCEDNYYDIDGNAANGCEYACTPTDPAVEACNLRDDDCDGEVDEGDPGGGVACGSAVGECVQGLTECNAGRILCIGEVRPTTELCNGLDDDCDTDTDEGNPEGGRVCGTSTGLCEIGSEECIDGDLVCVGAVGPAAETCNNLDEDCDGDVDEDAIDPTIDDDCGTDTGRCEFGAIACVSGALRCTGGIVPRDELCDTLDDDCDGPIDEENPQGGQICGTDVGICSTGTQQCTGGSLVCSGNIGPRPGGELCNGQDDDCNGEVDEGNPEGGALCGSGTGLCTQGNFQCNSGVLVCTGGTGPALDTCDGEDNDCDGGTDEDYSFDTDIRNCGTCGTICSFPNAVPRCDTGTCEIASCRSGFVDLDPLAPGCEYACEFSGAEVCNGEDDDCDGDTDEDVSIPADFCNPNGVCSTTEATCGVDPEDGQTRFICVYPSTFQESESRCDGLDNDCDGLVDEPYLDGPGGDPDLGETCFRSTGACETAGQYVCNATQNGLRCNAAAPGAPSDELCDGVDNDCDGGVDERGPDVGTDFGLGLDAIDTVPVVIGGVTVQVMAYEASRADAVPGTANAGRLGEIACSRPNVMPWTNVTWQEAQNACCELNENGQCPDPGQGGWRLCDAMDWEAACEGPSGTCAWSYTDGADPAACTTSDETACNGAEWDSNPASPGDQDRLYSTGSSTFPMCYTDWGLAGELYDMSGNVREWTATQITTGVYSVRGGSYNHIEAGRTCQWSFTVSQGTSAPNTGFRCCMYPSP